jgi:hypothetical protein
VAAYISGSSGYKNSHKPYTFSLSSKRLNPLFAKCGRKYSNSLGILFNSKSLI